MQISIAARFDAVGHGYDRSCWGHSRAIKFRGWSNSELCWSSRSDLDWNTEKTLFIDYSEGAPA